MPAAETPSAGHETAPSCDRLAVADPAAGVDVPEGHAVGEEWVADRKGNPGNFAVTRPASATRQASAIRGVRPVRRRR